MSLLDLALVIATQDEYDRILRRASEAGFVEVIRQLQQKHGQAHHWSLFVAEEGKNGTVYQVTGDHTHMVHGHKEGVNVLGFGNFADIHQLAELDAQKVERVAYWANEEPAPCAETQAQVRDTYQSWTL